MKIIVTIVLSLASLGLLGQDKFATCKLNASTTQTYVEFGFLNQSKSNFLFEIVASIGNYGKQTFNVNVFPNGGLNYVHSPYWKWIGNTIPNNFRKDSYSLSNKGFSGGLKIGKRIPVTREINCDIKFGISYYKVVDNHIHYYIDEDDRTLDFSNEYHTSHSSISNNLSASGLYSLNRNMAIEVGGSLNYYIPFKHTDYEPEDTELPMLGGEGVVFIGLQYKL